MSNFFEKIMFEFLMEFIGKHLDHDHFGGHKGSSITHYLELVNCIPFNQDLKDPISTLGMVLANSRNAREQNHKYLSKF